MAAPPKKNVNGRSRQTNLPASSVHSRHPQAEAWGAATKKEQQVSVAPGANVIYFNSGMFSISASVFAQVESLCAFVHQLKIAFDGVQHDGQLLSGTFSIYLFQSFQPTHPKRDVTITILSERFR